MLRINFNVLIRTTQNETFTVPKWLVFFLSHRSVFNVIPAQAGIQSIQLIAFWIAQKLHSVSRLRGNDEGFKRKLTDP